MSRNYDLTVRIKGINQEDISDFLEQHFGVYMDVAPDTIGNEIFIATGVVTLCGGQSDFEAHKELSEYFRGINPAALVKTQWTNLDDLPFESFGDDFPEEE